MDIYTTTPMWVFTCSDGKRTMDYLMSGANEDEAAQRCWEHLKSMKSEMIILSAYPSAVRSIDLGMREIDTVGD